MPRGRITTLAVDLESRGIETGGLRELQAELDLLESPPGVFTRLTRKMRAAADAQWGHALGELRESRRALALITRRLRSGEPLTADEADDVRGQLLDVLRVVPAGVIAVANSAFPVPGTGLLTPWLLARLGLMPSRWREAHLLHQLRQARERLHAEGHHQEAEEVEALEHRIEQEADAREEAEREAALLTHWDANRNGQWDADETAAYRTEVARLRTEARRHRSGRRWFLQHEGHVFGPVRLTELLAAGPDLDMLVCFDAKSGWVELSDLRETPGPPAGS